MKTRLWLLAVVSSGAVACAAGTGTILNPWSGVAGDKGNMVSFAFQADAGDYPGSVNPAGSLTPVFQLDAITLIRPADATTPSFGTGARQTTSADTPVFLDVYSGYDGAAYQGYLGSSLDGVTWGSTVSDGTYTFGFTGINLDAARKYWFVFSEDNADGEVSNFRMKLNTAGADGTPGSGKGYLVGDVAQAIAQDGAPRDWGVAYTVEFTAVPEPSVVALIVLGSLLWVARKRL